MAVLVLAVTQFASGRVEARCSGDDVLEPNSDCASAPLLPLGSWPRLIVHGGAGVDVFRVVIPADTTLRVEAHVAATSPAGLGLFLRDQDCLANLGWAGPHAPGGVASVEYVNDASTSFEVTVWINTAIGS